MRGPNGEIGKISAHEAEDSFRHGWAPISDQEHHDAILQQKYGDIGGQFAAGGESLARGLSGGLSDPAAVGIGRIVGGEPYAEAVRRHLAGEKEANPTISNIGESAGFIGGALATGGTEELGAEALTRGAAETSLEREAVAPAAKAAVEGIAPATSELTPQTVASVSQVSPGGIAESEASRDLARQELEKLNARQAASGLHQPESVLEATQKVTTPQSPVLGPDGLPLDPATVSAAPTPPPGVAPPLSSAKFGIEPPATPAAAADHIASRIAEQPGSIRTFLSNTPAAYISKAGRAAEEVAQGAVDEIFGEGVADTATGRVLTTAVKLGASGAIEYGLINMGSEISEDTLGDHEINAQKLLYAFSHGALVGSAFGGALGAGGAVAKEGALKFLNKYAPKITDLSRLQAFRAFGAGGGRGTVEKDAIRAFGDKGPMVLGDTAFKYNLLDGAPGPEVLYAKVESSAELVGKSLEDKAIGLDAVAERKNLVSLKDLEDRVYGRNGHDRAELMDMFQQFRETHGNITGLSEAEQQRLAGMNKALSEATAREGELYQNYMKLDEVAKKATGKASIADSRIAANAAKEEFRAATSAKINLLRESAELRAIHENSTLSKVMKGVSRSFGEDGRATFTELRDARIKIDGMVKNWIANPYGPEQAAPQLLLKHLRAKIEDAIIDAGDKLATENPKLGANWRAEYMGLKDDYRKLKFLQKKAEGSLAAKYKNQHLSLTGKLLGLGEFAHAGVAGIPKAAALMYAHKLVRDRGTAASALILDKLSQMALIQRTAAKVDRTIEAGTEGLMSRVSGSRRGRIRVRTLGKPAAQPEDHIEGRAAPHETIETVARLADVPNIEKEHAAVALGGSTTYAPKTAASLASRANVVSQYLLSKLPKSYNGSGDITAQTNNRLSDAELREFMNHYEGATDLKTTMRKIASGRATPEHIEALKKCAADIHAQIVSNIIASLNDMDPKERAHLPMSAQAELSMIIGSPVSWAFQPSSIKVFQANDIQVSQSDGRPAQGNQAPGRPAPARFKGTIAKQTQPEGNDHEPGEEN